MNDIMVHMQTVLWIDMKITKHIDKINIQKILNFTLINYSIIALNSTEHHNTCAEGLSNRQRILHICALCMLN
jgi:hypothetical protein